MESSKTSELSNAKQEPNLSFSFLDNDLAIQFIQQRLKSLYYSLKLLSHENKNELISKRNNQKPLIQISPYWTCHAHASCRELCEICCSCVLNMFTEVHLLEQRDHVGDNYVAVSNILQKLMIKNQIHHNNEQQQISQQKEAEENAKISEKNRTVERERKITTMLKFSNTTQELNNQSIFWPDDLKDLIRNWDNLPENRSKEQHKTTVKMTLKSQVNNKPNNTNSNSITSINSRRIINYRTVIPKPILTPVMGSNGRILASNIMKSHVIRHIATGRPIVSRIITGQSIINTNSLNRNNNNSNNCVVNTINSNTGPRQINNSNLTLVRYNPTAIISHVNSNTHKRFKKL